jgi:hypothetical protein
MARRTLRIVLAHYSLWRGGADAYRCFHPNPRIARRAAESATSNFRETTMEKLKQVLMVCSMIVLAGAAACASIDGDTGTWSQSETGVQLGDSQGG